METFCPLPWTHLFINPAGNSRLCCSAHGHAENYKNLINNKSFNKARLKMLNNERPSACNKYCYSTEDHGGYSKRNELLKEQRSQYTISFNDAVRNTNSDGSIKKDLITDLDLRIGNTCDLACVMCGSINSSKWAELEKEINMSKGMEHTFEDKWWENKKFWEELNEILLHAKLIKFGGGEPLLLKQHKDVLKFIKDNNPNCIIKYITNANNISQEYIDLWQDIPNLSFTFSIDSIENRIEYLRWPIKWDNCVRNMKRLKVLKRKPNVVINYTMTLFNILYVNEDLHWFSEKKNELGIDNINLNHVHHPAFLHAGLLPEDIKSNIHIDNEDYAKDVTAYLDSATHNELQWNQFLKYAERLDSARGTDCRKTFPALFNSIK